MRPIFVAIDTPDLGRAVHVGEAVAGVAGGLKLGLEFFFAHGPAGVAHVAELGLPLFLDLKLHDIPNTVARAVRALGPLRPAVLTVHAVGGRAMLEAAKEAAGDSTRLVAVTVLTSLDRSDLADCGIAGEPTAQVERLAALARSAGLDGIVCSGAEVAAASAAWPGGFFVVPGIRPPGEDSADQKRVATPAEALRDGASILVVGRPVTAAPDPGKAIRAIADSL